jgi:hypothetical protein
MRKVNHVAHCLVYVYAVYPGAFCMSALMRRTTVLALSVLFAAPASASLTSTRSGGVLSKKSGPQ